MSSLWFSLCPSTITMCSVWVDRFILGLIIWCLADAVQLGVFLALLCTRRWDHLLLLGLCWWHHLPLLFPFSLVYWGNSCVVMLRTVAMRVLWLVASGGRSLSPLLLLTHLQQVPLELLLRIHGVTLSTCHLKHLSTAIVKIRWINVWVFPSSIPGPLTAAPCQEEPASSGSPSWGSLCAGTGAMRACWHLPVSSWPPPPPPSSSSSLPAAHPCLSGPGETSLPGCTQSSCNRGGHTHRDEGHEDWQSLSN